MAYNFTLRSVSCKIAKWMAWFLLELMGCVIRVLGFSTQWLEKLQEWVEGWKSLLERNTVEWINDYLSDEDDTSEQGEFINVNNYRRKKGFTKRLAREAYQHFGPRKLNDANRLVTRKWMVKWVDENNTTMRIKDKIDVVDGALFLSFVPSDEFMRCERMAEQEPYLDLVPTGAETK